MRFTPFFFVDCETYISFVLGEEYSSWGLRIFLYPTLVTRRKNIFLNSSSSSKLTISTISIKNITLSTLLILAVCRTRVIIEESWWLSGRASERKSEGLRFDSSRGLRIFLYPTLVTRRKNIFLNSSSSSKLTISTISIKGKCCLFIT